MDRDVARLGPDRKSRFEFICKRCSYRESTYHPDSPPECIKCGLTMIRKEEKDELPYTDVGARTEPVKRKRTPYNTKVRRALREAKGSVPEYKSNKAADSSVPVVLGHKASNTTAKSGENRNLRITKCI